LLVQENGYSVVASSDIGVGQLLTKGSIEVEADQVDEQFYVYKRVLRYTAKVIGIEFALEETYND